ncbi:MAG: Hsp20/alpha crystallin family protein [Nanopusillaceae archaeon]
MAGDIDDIMDYIRKEWKRQMRLMRKLQSKINKLVNLGFIPFDYEEPLADIVDEGDKYVIELDLPGVDKKDINIIAKDRFLKVSAKRKLESKEKGENYIRMERLFTGYQRIFELPEDADVNNIKAKYENGVLRIEIKKKPGLEGKRIDVE